MVEWNNRGWVGKKTNYGEGKEYTEVVKKKGYKQSSCKFSVSMYVKKRKQLGPDKRN